MPKKKKKSGKHIPQRTCVGCHAVLSKSELMRIVRSKDGVRFDETGKAPGRGAYLHNRHSCWEQALKGSLANKLRTELTAQDKAHLQAIADSLPDTVEDE